MVIPARRSPKTTLRTDDRSVFHVKHRTGSRVGMMRSGRFSSAPRLRERTPSFSALSPLISGCLSGSTINAPLRPPERQPPWGGFRPSIRLRHETMGTQGVASRGLVSPLGGTSVQNGVDRRPPMRLLQTAQHPRDRIHRPQSQLVRRSPAGMRESTPITWGGRRSGISVHRRGSGVGRSNHPRRARRGFGHSAPRAF